MEKQVRNSSHENKRFAPGEARTHGLQIMRLTRCLLRYGGLVNIKRKYLFQIQHLEMSMCSLSNYQIHLSFNYKDY